MYFNNPYRKTSDEKLPNKTLLNQHHPTTSQTQSRAWIKSRKKPLKNNKL